MFLADNRKTTLQTPLPPPPWTDNPLGIPLQTAPICKYCAEDLTVLEEAAPSTPPQTPLPPSPEPPFRAFPQWMAKLPSNRAKKTAPSCPNPTNTPRPSPPTVHLSTDSCVSSHLESLSEGILLTHSLSTNIQSKALLGHKASSAAITRRKSLNRKYGDRAPPYMRELSAVFSDHQRKEGLRSRTDKKWRRIDEGNNDGERGGEGIISTDGHGRKDGGGRDLSLDKEEEGSEEGLCLWEVG
ncbi:hypothetical protein MMC29_002499 [Sticta canariensis]|nr:hypothetical protein [Sticta canariensis]